MFKHILIPTDGSPVAEKAVKAGIELAKDLGAKVTGYYALEPLGSHLYGEGYLMGKGQISKVLEERAREVAQKRLEKFAAAAKAAGVAFNTVIAVAETPYDGIIDAAKKAKCDAIFMASHGRRGIQAMMIGSVTQKVLTNSKLPVLVYR